MPIHPNLRRRLPQIDRSTILYGILAVLAAAGSVALIMVCTSPAIDWFS